IPHRYVALGEWVRFFHLESLYRRLCLRKGFVRVCARNGMYQKVKSAAPTRHRRADQHPDLRTTPFWAALKQAERRFEAF
ncbi:hypothetical protein, partial [Aquidulcibacter paucihalophilus]|uniref:hypothetical protein n=1 Tax=Aquidulcibacter paucihalophilus TaxID=1978549 RepID=UPI001E4E7E6B